MSSNTLNSAHQELYLKHQENNVYSAVQGDSVKHLNIVVTNQTNEAIRNQSCASTASPVKTEMTPLTRLLMMDDQVGISKSNKTRTNNVDSQYSDFQISPVASLQLESKSDSKNLSINNNSKNFNLSQRNKNQLGGEDSGDLTRLVLSSTSSDSSTVSSTSVSHTLKGPSSDKISTPSSQPYPSSSKLSISNSSFANKNLTSKGKNQLDDCGTSEKIVQELEKCSNLSNPDDCFVLLIDSTGTILHVSKGIQNVTDFIPVQLHGRNFANFFQNDDRQRVLKVLQKLSSSQIACPNLSESMTLKFLRGRTDGRESKFTSFSTSLCCKSFTLVRETQSIESIASVHSQRESSLENCLVIVFHSICSPTADSKRATDPMSAKISPDRNEYRGRKSSGSILDELLSTSCSTHNVMQSYPIHENPNLPSTKSSDHVAETLISKCDESLDSTPNESWTGQDSSLPIKKESLEYVRQSPRNYDDQSEMNKQFAVPTLRSKSNHHSPIAFDRLIIASEGGYRLPTLSPERFMDTIITIQDTASFIIYYECYFPSQKDLSNENNLSLDNMKWLDIVNPTDVELWNKHSHNAFKKLSESQKQSKKSQSTESITQNFIYRAKLATRWKFLNTLSIAQSANNDSQPYLISYHSIIRDCESETELKGNPTTSLHKCLSQKRTSPHLSQSYSKLSPPLMNHIEPAPVVHSSAGAPNRSAPSPYSCSTPSPSYQPSTATTIQSSNKQKVATRPQPYPRVIYQQDTTSLKQPAGSTNVSSAVPVFVPFGSFTSASSVQQPITYTSGKMNSSFHSQRSAPHPITNKERRRSSGSRSGSEQANCPSAQGNMASHTPQYTPPTKSSLPPLLPHTQSSTKISMSGANLSQTNKGRSSQIQPHSVHSDTNFSSLISLGSPSSQGNFASYSNVAEGDAICVSVSSESRLPVPQAGSESAGMNQPVDKSSETPTVSSASNSESNHLLVSRVTDNLEEIFPGFHESLQSRHSSQHANQRVTMEDRAKMFQHLPLEARERIRQKTLHYVSKDDLVQGVRQILIEYLGEANFSESCRKYLERGLSSCAMSRPSVRHQRSRISSTHESESGASHKTAPGFLTKESPGHSMQSPEEGPGSSPQEQVAQSTTDIDEEQVATSYSARNRERCPSGVSAHCSNWLNSIQTVSASSSIDESNGMNSSSILPSSSNGSNATKTLSTSRYESNQSETFLGITRKTDKHTNNSLLIKLLYESNDPPKTDAMSVSSTQSPLAGDAWAAFNHSLSGGATDGDQGKQTGRANNRHRFVSGSPTSSVTPAALKLLPSGASSDTNKARSTNGELCRLLENSPPTCQSEVTNAGGDTSVFDFTDVTTTSTSVSAKSGNTRKRKSPLTSLSSSHNYEAPSPKRAASDQLLQRMLSNKKEVSVSSQSTSWKEMRSPTQNNRILSQLLSSSEAPSASIDKSTIAGSKSSCLISEAVKRPQEVLSQQQSEAMRFANTPKSSSNPPSLTPNEELSEVSDRKPLSNVNNDPLSGNERSPFDWDLFEPDFDLDNYIKELDSGTADDADHSQKDATTIDYDDAYLDSFNSLLFSGVENAQDVLTCHKSPAALKLEETAPYSSQQQRSNPPPMRQKAPEPTNASAVLKSEQQRKLEEVNINLEDLEEILRQEEKSTCKYPKSLLTTSSKLNLHSNYHENYSNPSNMVASESEREVNRIKQELSSIISEDASSYDQHMKNQIRNAKTNQSGIEQQLNFAHSNHSMTSKSSSQEMTGMNQRQDLLHNDFSKLGSSQVQMSPRIHPPPYNTQFSQYPQDRTESSARLAADRQRLIERQEQQQFQSRMNTGGYNRPAHISHQQPIINPPTSVAPGQMVNKGSRPLGDNFAKLMKEVGPNVNVQTQQSTMQPRFSQSMMPGSDSAAPIMSSNQNNVKMMMPSNLTMQQQQQQQQMHRTALPTHKGQPFNQSQTQQQHIVRGGWEQSPGQLQHLPGNILTQGNNSQDIQLARTPQSSPIVNQESSANSVILSGYSHAYHLSDSQNNNAIITSRPQTHSPSYNVISGQLAISPNTPHSANLGGSVNIGNSRQVKNELRQMVANRSSNQQHQLASQLSSTNSKSLQISMSPASTPNTKLLTQGLSQQVSSTNHIAQHSNAAMQKQRLYMQQQQQQQVRMQQQSVHPPPPPSYPTLHQSLSQKLQQPSAQATYPSHMPSDRMSGPMPRPIHPELMDSMQQQRLFHHHHHHQQQQQQQQYAMQSRQRFQQQPGRLMTRVSHGPHSIPSGIMIGQVNASQPQNSNHINNDNLLTTLLINQSAAPPVQSSVNASMSVSHSDPLVVSSTRISTSNSESVLPDYIADTLFDLENSISTSSASLHNPANNSMQGSMESAMPPNYRPQNLSSSSPLTSQNVNSNCISTSSSHYDLSTPEYQFVTGSTPRESATNKTQSHHIQQQQQQPKQGILEKLLSNNSNQ